MTDREETQLRQAVDAYLADQLPRFRQMIDTHTPDTRYDADQAEFLYTLCCAFSKKCEMQAEDYARLEEECEETILAMCEKFGK